jgi:hypothetical protein
MELRRAVDNFSGVLSIVLVGSLMRSARPKGRSFPRSWSRLVAVAVAVPA